MNSPNLFTCFRRSLCLLKSRVLFCKLWGSLNTSIYRGKWFIQLLLFVMLFNFHLRCSLVTDRIVLCFPWIILIWLKALLSTAQMRILVNILVCLLSLDIYARIFQNGGSLIFEFISTSVWACILFVILVKYFRQSNNLRGVLLMSSRSFVPFSLRLAFYWFDFLLDSHCLALCFNPFFNIFVKCIEIILYLILLVYFYGHLQAFLD